MCKYFLFLLFVSVLLCKNVCVMLMRNSASLFGKLFGFTFFVVVAFFLDCFVLSLFLILCDNMFVMLLLNECCYVK